MGECPRPVCTHAVMQVFMHVWLSVCMHSCMHIWVYACACTCIYDYNFMHACMSVYLIVCIYACIHAAFHYLLYKYISLGQKSTCRPNKKLLWTICFSSLSLTFAHSEALMINDWMRKQDMCIPQRHTMLSWNVIHVSWYCDECGSCPSPLTVRRSFP